MNVSRLNRHLATLATFFIALLMSVPAFAGTPNFSLSFSPSTIAPGSISTLTYTIDNYANSNYVSDIAFSNTLPSGMTIANPSNATTTCSSGSFTATAGSSSISFSGYRLGQTSSCTFRLDVTSSVPGSHVNTTSSLTSSAGTSTAATNTLTVDATRPGFSMAFSPSTITPGNVSTLTYTLDNTYNGSNSQLLIFTHNLTSGLTIASDPNISTTCPSGTLAGTPGATTISLSYATVNAGSTCTLSINITAAQAGIYSTTTGQLSQNNANPSGAATAQLTVETPFMHMNFPNSASPGESITLSYTLTNTDRSNSATDISFTNDLNATLSGLAATALPASDFCGTGSTISGSSNITVNGANLASGSSCTFSITVLVPSNAAAGNYTNTTSTINLTLGSPTTKTAATNTLTIKKAPLVTLSFIDDPVGPGQDVTARFTVTNTDSTNSASSIAFTANMSAAIVGLRTKTLPASNSCGSGSTFTETTPNGEEYSFALNNANLVGGGNCTFDVIMTLPLDAQPGTFTMSTSTVSATLSGSTVYGPSTSDTIIVVTPPQLQFGITESSTTAGSNVTAQFTLSYSANASADVTGVDFTVDLNAALTGLTSTTATQTNVCGTGSSLSGTSILSLNSASLSPGNSCTFSVTLAVPSNATAGLVTVNTSTVTGTTSGKSVNSASTSDTLLISGLSFSHQFLTNPALPNSNNTIRYTISNAAGAADATAIQFTHNLSQIYTGISSTSLPTDPCGAGSSLIQSTSLAFANGSLTGGTSCTFDVPISIPTGVTAGAYNSTTSDMSATVNDVNTNTEASTSTLNVETLTVVLATTAGTSTSTSPIPVSVTFNRNVTGLTASDFSVSNGTAAEPVGSGSSYTVDITPSTDGTVTVSLPANAVDDAVDATHKNPLSNTLSIAYTSTPATPTPTLVIASPNTDKATTGPVTYTVTYTNAAEVNLTPSHITLNKTGTANASVSVTGGTTNTPTVSINSISGDGTLGISIAAGSARNGTEVSAAAGPSTTFIVDNTKPTVTISDSVAAAVNTPFTATFTFSEAVSNFVIGDISASNAALTNFNAVSSTVYTVLVTPSSEGVVTLDVAAGVADDNVGLTNTAATQHSVTYDVTAPTLVVSGPSGPVNGPFEAIFTFSEDVTGFTMSDITVTNGSLSNFITNSASVYKATVTPSTQGAVTVTVAASLATDSASNNNVGANVYTVTYDSVQPTVIISGGTNPTNAAFTATFTFSEDVTGFAQADIVVTNAQMKDFSALSAKVYTITVTPTTDGQVTLDVAANAAVDPANNGNTAASQYIINYDATKPGITISGPTAPINTAFTATFTFTEDVSGFTIDDIAATNASLSNFQTTSASVYTATVTPATDGNVLLNVAVDLATDTAGNGNTVATQFSVVYDATGPDVTISGPTSAVNAAFTATITFTEDVSNFVLADINAGNATLTNFAATSAAIYTVTVTPSTQGAVTLDVAANKGEDIAGNGNKAASQYSVIYDTVQPTVIISGGTNPTNAAFTATFTFSEDVTGFAQADIVVTNAQMKGFSALSAKVYTITVTPTTDGQVTLDVAANAAVDTANNGNTAASQYIINYDATKPGITISGPTAPINTAFTATFTFTEDVSGFTIDDIAATNASLSNFQTTSASVYTATVTPATDGNVLLNVAVDLATDAAGNGNTVATQFSVVYDATGPDVTISGPAGPVNAAFTATITFTEDVSNFVLADINAGNATLTNFAATSAAIYTVTVTPSTQGAVTLDIAASQGQDIAGNGNKAATQYSVVYDSVQPTVAITGVSSIVNAAFTATFTFSENVTGFTSTDITLNNAVASDFNQTSASVYTAKITPTTDGAVTINVNAGVATDSAGNSNTAASQVSTTYDSTSPTLSIVGPTAPINTAFTATFNFSESVTGFDVADITVINAQLSNFAAARGDQYSVTVTPSSDGNVKLSVAASLVVDSAGNGNIASSELVVVYDTTAPSVAVSGPTAPTNAAFTATVTFSEDVTGFTQADITAGNANLSNFASTSASVYTVLVTPTSQQTVTLDIAAAVAVDQANNSNQAAGQFTVLYDSTSPTVTISGPTTVQNAAFTAAITFSEAVSGFEVADITATNSVLSNFSGIGTSYTVTVTPSSDGAVTLNIAASLAHDPASNGNVASNIYSVDYDASAPTLVISGPVGPVSTSFTATFTFSEVVTDFTSSDIKLTNASQSGFTTTDNKVFTALITPLANGDATIDVAAAVAQDSAGNNNLVASQYKVTYDNTRPGITIAGPTGSTNTPFTATLTFSKAVNDFSQSKITVVNAQLSNFDSSAAPKYSVLVTPSTEANVTLQILEAAVQDPAGNNNTASNLYSITYDTTTPAIQTVSPVNNAVDVPVTPELILTFQENVIAGSTNNQISVKELSTGNIIETIGADTTAVSISGNTVKVALAKSYDEYANYYVNIDANAFIDAAGNPFTGISDTTSWQFRIINLPPLTATDILVLNEDNGAKIQVLSNDENSSIKLVPSSLMIKTLPGNGEVEVNPATGIISFKPNHNFYGSDKFTYSISDILGQESAETIVSVSVKPANDAPYSNNDVVTTAQNNLIIVNVLNNDTDPDGSIDSSGLRIVRQPANGDAEVVNGQVNYTPHNNYTGMDSFDYIVVDNDGLTSNIATAYIDVLGTNSPPTAAADSAATNENTAVLIEVLNNDSDTDGSLQPNSVTIIAYPSNGDVSVGSTGVVTYTPDFGFSGGDNFSYIVQDNGNAISANTQVSITVNATNDAPEAFNDTLVLVDTVNTHKINVLGNDRDADGNIVAVNIVSQPSSGTVQVDSTSLMVSYTPATSFSGSDSFSYQVVDNNDATSATATVSVTTSAQNDPPLANDDSVQTAEDQFVGIKVVSNDIDIDGVLDMSTLTITTAPSNGSAAVSRSDGTIFYTPNANYSGQDQFIYQIADNSGATASATVWIQINGVNDVPQAVHQSLQTNEDTSLNLTLTALDADNDNLHYELARYPNNGTLSGSLPDLTYTPEANFNGSDSFTFFVSDENAQSEVATISITVNPVNDQPTASSQSVQMNEDSSLAVFLDGQDIDNDSLTYTIKTQPTNGTLTGIGANRVYRPNANFVGSDRFTFVANDGTLDSAEATVELTIIAVNDAPVANNQTVSAVEDTTLEITLSAVDNDSENLTYTIVGTPTNGQITGIAPNLTYRPSANFYGSDSFTFKANDGSLDSNIATVEINVSADNDAPVATNMNLTTNEDTQLAIRLNASDIDSTALSYTVTSQPLNGRLSGVAPNLVYTPNSNFNGSDSFSYIASDTISNSQTANVNININAVNDIPVAVDDTVSRNDWQSFDINVLDNDSDNDGDSLTVTAATATSGTAATNGTVINYTPVNGFVGSTVIDYSISDNQGGSANARVIINISAPSDSAVALINVPADIEVQADALLTKVELGVATAFNSQGDPLTVTLQNDSNYFKPGINTVYWQATDEQGNTTTASQQVKVHPQISIDTDRVAIEGFSATVAVHLSGQAPEYPVHIPYTVRGSATYEEDHNLADGIVTIESGTEGRITFSLLSDTLTDEHETLVIALDEQLNLGEQASHTMTLTEQNLPPQLSFKVLQDGVQNVTVYQDGPTVEVIALAQHQNEQKQYLYSWSADNEWLAEQLNSTEKFTFNAADLLPGTYQLAVTVQDSEDAHVSQTKQLNINVVEFAEPLTTQDSDNDGISDIAEGRGDLDNDGIADHLDAISHCNLQQTDIRQAGRYLIQTQPDHCLSLGQSALRQAANTVVMEQDGAQYWYDIVVQALADNGQTATIVLPQLRPIGEAAVYRQRQADGNWQDFVEDGSNQLMSAAGAAGYCPPPNDIRWQPGLNAGHWCIQVSISDGGANDMDGQANGTILMPGGLALRSDNSLPQSNNDQVEARWNHVLTIDALANDSDIDGDALQLTSAQALLGQVSIVDNKLSYQPIAGLLGDDTVTYGVSDGNGGTSSATVTISVKPNQLPEAVADSVEVTAGDPIVIDVLLNDTDADGDTLLLLQATADNGQIKLEQDNRISYTANSSFSGIDTINYLITDGFGGTAQGQVQVTVKARQQQTEQPSTPQADSTSSGGGALLWLWVMCLGLSTIRRSKR